MKKIYLTALSRYIISPFCYNKNFLVSMFDERYPRSFIAGGMFTFSDFILYHYSQVHE
jgi:hypothetical protein